MDICCAPARSQDDADSLSSLDVYTLLSDNEMGLKTLFWLQAIIYGLWIMTSLAPGFDRYDGTGTNAVTHIGWWALADFLVLIFQAFMFGFNLHYTRKGYLELGAGRMLDYLVFVAVLSILSIAANIVHVVLTMFEVSVCNSTFCTKNYAVMIVFIVFLYVLPVLRSWQVYRVLTYRANLTFALATNKARLDVMGGGDKIVEEDSSINPVQTPLLAKYARRTGRK